MKSNHKNSFFRKAFSLAEVLMAVTVGSMVLIAAVGLYSKIEGSAEKIFNKLDAQANPRQILQRIAEDIDRVVVASDNISITFANKPDSSMQNISQLIIEKTINTDETIKETFEKIIWQTFHDSESSESGLILYRSHDGIGLVEDKILEEFKTDEERKLFIPLAQGITYFNIQTKVGDDFLDKWTDKTKLPVNLVFAISFADPVEIEPGQWEVPPSQIFTRTVAVDRTRKISFKVIEKIYDPNEFDFMNIDVNDVNGIIDSNNVD